MPIDLEEAPEKLTFLWGFFAFGVNTVGANACEIRKLNDDASGQFSSVGIPCFHAISPA
jgi:hypothetical protein